jgi:hypothetical protein
VPTYVVVPRVFTLKLPASIPKSSASQRVDGICSSSSANAIVIIIRQNPSGSS